MSFVNSAEDIRLEDDHVLIAQLRNGDDEMQDASIDLNEVLGNNEGNFEWEGRDFIENASDISLEIVEGDDILIPVLRADLPTGEDDESNSSEINLAERIVNDYGNFAFAQGMVESD